MALGNIRERLQLHFDAEGTLESRVRESTYEVHIRMPYRTARPAAALEGRPGPAEAGARAGREAPPPPQGRRDVVGPPMRVAGPGVSRV